ASPALGDVELVDARVVRDTKGDASIDFQRDRHREDRQPVRVVRRAVQWIDDSAAPRAAGRGATLLRENRIVRERRGEPADDQLLGALVHFRHEVGRLALKATRCAARNSARKIWPAARAASIATRRSSDGAIRAAGAWGRAAPWPRPPP